MTAAMDLVVVGRFSGHSGDRLSAVGVRDGIIQAVGELADVREWRNAKTELIGGADSVVLPGLVDGHSHPMLGAASARGIDLTSVRTRADLTAALRHAATALPANGWLLGWGLTHDVWQGDRIDNAVLDTAVPNVPMFIRFFDAHSALASTAALHIAQIHAPRAFTNGAVVADQHGDPTGLLLEIDAMQLIEEHIPGESRRELRDRLGHWFQRMAAAGLTGAHVMDFNDHPEDLYTSLIDANELPLRLTIYPWVLPQHDEADWTATAELLESGSETLRFGGVKTFLDGTIDNGTAWLSVPDVHGASTHSSWESATRYLRMVEFFAHRGVPVATHAIGDAATRCAAAGAVAARRIDSSVRSRIEHLEYTDDAVLDAVAASGAIASMQPTHCTHYVHADGSDNWSTRIGPDRARHGWRTRSVLDRGIPLVLGSDWPVAPFDPLEIIGDAQLRRRVDNPNQTPVVSAEAIGAAEALHAFTTAPATATNTDLSEGRIAAGYRADITVVAQDPATLGPGMLRSSMVSATVMNGVVRFHR